PTLQAGTSPTNWPKTTTNKQLFATGKKINDLLYQTWPSSLDGEKITMTTNTTIHNNHHVIYKPWHTCRPYDNI
ncbi:hypothetical protein B179_11362, partial [Corynebacterium diphtheriae str. Aberdeen]